MLQASHHYVFAHRYLPRMLLGTQGAQRWLPILRGPRGDGFLASLWPSAGKDLAPEARRPPGAFATRVCDGAGGLALTLIAFPPPAAPPEAHFALIASEPLGPSAHEVLRYLTLERGDGGLSFVGEWHAGGRHVGHGPLAGEASEAAFIAAAGELLGVLADPASLRLRSAEQLTEAVAGAPDATLATLAAAAAGLAATHSWGPLAVALATEAERVGGAHAALLYAQALWLSMHPQAPPELALAVAGALLQALEDGAPLAGLAAAAARHKALTTAPREASEALGQQGFHLLLRAAGPDVAPVKERFMAWADERGLVQPSVFMPRLYDALLAFVPESAWRFDPYAVVGLLFA